MVFEVSGATKATIPSSAGTALGREWCIAAVLDRVGVGDGDAGWLNNCAGADEDLMEIQAILRGRAPYADRIGDYSREVGGHVRHVLLLVGQVCAARCDAQHTVVVAANVDCGLRWYDILHRFE